MKDKNSNGTIGWFVVGSLTGACAALLLAPASGKRTRERLARRIRDTKDTVADFTDDLADTTRDIAEEAVRIKRKAARIAGNATAAAREAVGLGDHRVHAMRRL
jgi:gas vesicle protein